MAGVRFFGSAALVAALLAFVAPAIGSASDQSLLTAGRTDLTSSPSPADGPLGAHATASAAAPAPASPSTPATASTPASASPERPSRTSPQPPPASTPSSAPASPTAVVAAPAVPSPGAGDSSAPDATIAPAASTPAAPAGGGVIHLTFDDGPDPAWTPQILSVLQEYAARATFFEIGRQAAAHPDLVAAVRAGGHAVGNHTWSHPDLSKLAAGAVTQQLADTTATLGGATCMRPPYGAVGGPVRASASAAGLAVTLWDVDTRDWQRPGADVIAQRAIAGARDGSIILLHDGGADRSQTLAATRTILSTLTAAGWRFEPVPGC